jgi:dihydrofolate reductase
MLQLEGGWMSTGKARVVWHTTMSLDGFIADPAEEMDWVFDVDGGDGKTAAETSARLGALVVGRRTMDVEDRQQPGFYGGAFSGPYFVISGQPLDPPTVKGVRGLIHHGPIERTIAAALAAAGGRDVGVLGATTARHALEAGLVDDVIVQVVPVLLGEGIPLHRGSRHRLRLVDSYRDGDVTTMHFSARTNDHGAGI